MLFSSFLAYFRFLVMAAHSRDSEHEHERNDYLHLWVLGKILSLMSLPSWLATGNRKRKRMWAAYLPSDGEFHRGRFLLCISRHNDYLIQDMVAGQAKQENQFIIAQPV